jgi:cellulose biosynthesis protein BcsQ
MHIVTAYARKGGVGKTSSAGNLAIVAAQLRIPTLLVDCSPQGDLTRALVDPRSPIVSIAALLEGGGLANRALQASHVQDNLPDLRKSQEFGPGGRRDVEWK